MPEIEAQTLKNPQGEPSTAIEGEIIPIRVDPSVAYGLYEISFANGVTTVSRIPEEPTLSQEELYKKYGIVPDTEAEIKAMQRTDEQFKEFERQFYSAFSFAKPIKNIGLSGRAIFSASAVASPVLACAPVAPPPAEVRPAAPIPGRPSIPPIESATATPTPDARIVRIDDLLKMNDLNLLSNKVQESGNGFVYLDFVVKDKFQVLVYDNTHHDALIASAESFGGGKAADVHKVDWKTMTDKYPEAGGIAIGLSGANAETQGLYIVDKSGKKALARINLDGTFSHVEEKVAPVGKLYSSKGIGDTGSWPEFTKEKLTKPEARLPADKEAFNAVLVILRPDATPTTSPTPEPTSAPKPTETPVPKDIFTKAKEALASADKEGLSDLAIFVKNAQWTGEYTFADGSKGVILFVTAENTPAKKEAIVAIYKIDPETSEGVLFWKDNLDSFPKQTFTQSPSGTIQFKTDAQNLLVKDGKVVRVLYVLPEPVAIPTKPEQPPKDSPTPNLAVFGKDSFDNLGGIWKDPPRIGSEIILWNGQPQVKIIDGAKLVRVAKTNEVINGVELELPNGIKGYVPIGQIHWARVEWSISKNNVVYVAYDSNPAYLTPGDNVIAKLYVSKDGKVVGLLVWARVQ